MYKNGFEFEITGYGITGLIDGVTTDKIYSVCFFANGSMYSRADLRESDITNNLKCGVFKEVKE